MYKLVLRRVNGSNLKEVAWKALEEYKSFIFEVDSATAWLEKVMKSPKPVILQAYANWSIPCRKLTPILEKKTLESEGQWCYGRLDIDEVPDVASALQVSIVPTIFLINKGHSINRLEGLPTEETIKDLIDDVKILAGLDTDENIFKALLMAAQEFLHEKKYDDAIKTFNQALNVKEFTEKYQVQCWFGLLKAYFLKGYLDKAEEYSKKINSSPGEINSEIKEYLDKISNAKENINQKSSDFLKKKKEIEDKLITNSNNFELRSELAILYYNNSLYQEAIETALKTIELENSFTGHGQKTIIFILNNLGPSHILTKPTRKRLQQLHSKYNV
jgi:thioredoxin 1